MKITNIDLMASAQCNLNCSYCYIDLDKVKNYNQNQIIKSIEDHSFLDMIKYYDIVNDITSLGLWGREPTFTIHKYAENIDYILSVLPNLEEISFSTNFIDISNLKIFLEKIIDKKLRINCQISLDVGEEITNRFRGNNKSIYKKIIENIEDVFSFIESFKKDINISFRDKTTLSLETINYLNNKCRLKDVIISYMNDTDKILKKYNRIKFKRFNTNLDIEKKYKVEDGKNLANLISQYIEINHLYPQIEIPYLDQIKRIIDNAMPHTITCSAMKNMMSIDGKNIHVCHRTYFTNEHEKMPEGSLQKIKYSFSSHHYFNNWKIQYSKSILHELALTGLISKRYLQDKELIRITSYFLNFLSCIAYNMELKGQVSIFPIATPILLCNGTVEKIIEEIQANV